MFKIIPFFGICAALVILFWAFIWGRRYKERWSHDYGKKQALQEAAVTQIWYALRDAGMSDWPTTSRATSDPNNRATHPPPS